MSYAILVYHAFCCLICRRVALVASVLGLLIPAAHAQAPIGSLDPEMFYHWQHPRPVGEQLIDLHVFNDSCAVALSSTNYAVRTINGGRSWRYQAVGSVLGDEYPQRLAFAGDTLGWVAQAYSLPPNCSGLRIRRTLDGGRTWTTCLQQAPLGCGAKVLDMQFVTRRHGFLLYRYDTDYRLIRTTDGGTTWTPASAAIIFQNIPGRYGNPVDLHFISPTEGWIACGQEGNGGMAGSILHTTDGGLTWQPQTPLGDHTVPYSAVGFARDGLHGWAFSTSSGFCYRTTDGGQQWALMSGVYANYTHRCSVLDAQHVSIGGFVTTDGGLSWVSGGPSAVGYISQLQLAATGRGWGLREIGGIFRTLDYGQRWLPDSAVSRSTGIVKGFAFHGDARRGWALFSQTFPLRTTTRGQRWKAVDEGQAVPTAWQQNGGYQVLDAATVDLDTAMVLVKHRLSTSTLDFEQNLLCTTDGGQTWQVQALPPQAQYASELAYYNSRHGCAVGYNGEAYFTHDGGQTWRVTNLSTNQQISLVSWASPTRLSMAFGINRDSLLLSADGGQTWQKVVSPIGGLYSPVAWRTSREAWLGTASSTLLRSTDGGRTWAPVSTSVSPSQLALFPYETRRELMFLDSARASARDARPLYSADQGQTWVALSPRNNLPPTLGLLDHYNGWFCGNSAITPYGAYSGILHYSEKFLQADTALARTAYCVGASLALSFTRTGTFGSTEQAVVAELSDAYGRFGRYPRVVGQGTTSPLTVVLPAALLAGTGYLLRVSLPDHSIIGGDNQHPLTISTLAVATISPAGPALRVCDGGTLTLSAPAGQAQYLWSTGATTPSITVGTAGSYTVQVAGVAGCLGPPAPFVAVSVDPVPATPVLVRDAATGQLTVTTPLAGASYIWTLNGSVLTTAMGPVYPAAGAGIAPVGIYSVMVVSAAGCASPDSTPLTVVLAARAATSTELRLYPNPARTMVVVERANGGGMAQVAILDAVGRCQFQGTMRGGQLQVPVHNLAPGLYVVRLQTADGTVGQRLTVER
jgi:photosystem II stability/assembly factor-like uncharacterized protein